MKKIIGIFCVIIFAVNITFAQQAKNEDHEKFVFDCSTCHICEKPTKKNPCLKECPRFELITIHHSPEEGPEVIIMDGKYEGNDIYDKVIFTHRLHAEMSGMSSGCAMCHHYNPPGSILPCKDCHEIERSRRDITKPDLKGAYHRQCMNCHREWEHTVDCISCHELREDGKPEQTEQIGDLKQKGHANFS